MLYVFYLDVAYIFVMDSQVFSGFFVSVSDACVSSVSSVFRRMLQMFNLHVSKVDRMLHMLQWCQWLVGSGLPQASALSLCGAPRPLLFSLSPPFPSLPSILTR
jgi:hypothetical protein